MLSSFPAIFLNILSFAQNSFCVMFEKSHSQNYFLPALWKLYSMSVSAFSLYFCFLENLLCFAKYAFGQDTLSFRIAFFFQTIKFSRYGFSFTYTTVFSFTLTTFFPFIDTVVHIAAVSSILCCFAIIPWYLYMSAETACPFDPLPQMYRQSDCIGSSYCNPHMIP